MTLILRVVVPQTLGRTMDIQGDPNPSLFFLASSNLEDEIHFKGGRFVTSQIFIFGMLIRSLLFIMISMHCLSFS